MTLGFFDLRVFLVRNNALHTPQHKLNDREVSKLDITLLLNPELKTGT